MTAKEFFDLVSDMRKIQKAYFQCGKENVLEKRSILSKCKSIEKLIDDEILRVARALADKKQGRLDL